MKSRKKSEYCVLSLEYDQVFKDADHVRKELREAFPDRISCEAGDALGYIEPGHGCRGKQRWITSDNDVSQMYDDHKGKKEILLWAYSREAESTSLAPPPSSKRHHSSTDGRGQAENIASKLTEVEEIYDTLSEKHSTTYTVEQLRAWAHLIQMKKHCSYDHPPEKPFFKRKREKHSGVTSTATVDESTRSPGKRIGLRTQCIDQLQKWHSLLESGAVSQEQYDELQKSILDDIKQL